MLNTTPRELWSVDLIIFERFNFVTTFCNYRVCFWIRFKIPKGDKH